MVKVILLTLFSLASPADSLRLETINGKTFIIHQVSAGETLYAIAKRYKASVAALKASNENAEAGIKEGQLLKVPYEKKVEKAVAKDSKSDEKKTVEKPKKPQEQQTHVVAAKETLSSIARQYKLSLKQLKDLNSLTSDEVKIGQSLIVSIAQPVVEKKQIQNETPITKKEVKVEKQTTSEKAVVETPPTKPIVKPEIKSVDKKEDVVMISENTPGSDEIKETGLAEIMEGTEGTRKYLAQHRTIKVGSIVKIRNESTNKEVFVRVTGNIPSGADEKVIIKISKSAFDRLGGTDATLTAEVTYYK